MERWLTDWLTNWLADWLTGWLADWLTDWLAEWLTDRLTDWLTGWLTDWLTHWLTHWLTDWLTGWLTDWLTHWLTHSLADWLTEFTLSLNLLPDFYAFNAYLLKYCDEAKHTKDMKTTTTIKLTMAQIWNVSEGHDAWLLSYKISRLFLKWSKNASWNLMIPNWKMKPYNEYHLLRK